MNGAKILILSAMENRGWMTSDLIARLSGVEEAHKYLYEYRRWGIVKRHTQGQQRPLFWRITPRGIDRLRWLRGQFPPEET